MNAIESYILDQASETWESKTSLSFGQNLIESARKLKDEGVIFVNQNPNSSAVVHLQLLCIPGLISMGVFLFMSGMFWPSMAMFGIAVIQMYQLISILKMITKLFQCLVKAKLCESVLFLSTTEASASTLVERTLVGELSRELKPDSSFEELEAFSSAKRSSIISETNHDEDFLRGVDTLRSTIIHHMNDNFNKKVQETMKNG